MCVFVFKYKDYHLPPVSYSDVAAIFEGYLFGVNLITGVTMSPPAL